MRSKLRTFIVGATAYAAASMLSVAETSGVDDRTSGFLKAFSSVAEHFETNIGQMDGDVLCAFRKDGYRPELLQKGVRLAMPQPDFGGPVPMQIQFRGSRGTATASGVNPLPFQVMQRPVKGGILQALQAGVDVRLRTD